MTVSEEGEQVEEAKEDAAKVQEWVGYLKEFVASLDGLAGDQPEDFCGNAIEVWKSRMSPDVAPLPSNPAMVIIVETLRALAQVMTAVLMDHANTPDARDRMTRVAAQNSLQDALGGIVRDGRRWLSEGLPTSAEIQERIASAVTGISAAQEAAQQQMDQDSAADAAAAADPYGAILGYRDPDVDAAIIFTKVCSFTENEDKCYRDAYDRLRRMLDSELLRHVSDESDRFCDVLIEVITDLRDRRISLVDEDAIDERRRRLRSALISFTSALHSHKDQSIRAVRDLFGRKTTEEQAVLDLFDGLLSTSFDYRWLLEMRDALLHGDINAFKYNFAARLHGEPAVNVCMDRDYMLHFTREARKKPWLKRSELEQMTADPSVLDMVNAIQPQMVELQEKLDAILYPNTATDAATVKELIGRFNGRQGLYALQNGPGFTRRLWIPPYMTLAPRVLAFADNYVAGN
ncbi:hypothetical protein [Nocardia mexicana]|uniref:Uncharacterized protein n=1 Tax=Nocardia mexicana TaxID=279262 RepID=A0A370HGL9_9NOCA|nr:hypothetical protein [Nocardia mexicana]RDI55920.1 hypothetical protein DFR68_101757 [Nocardia mexicana]